MSITIKDNSVEFERILDENIDDFLEIVGNFLVGEAELRCPVDTGNLAGSITYATNDIRSEVRPSKRETGQHSGKKRTYTITQVDAVKKPRGNNTVHIGTSVKYAAAVELGTVKRATTSLLSGANEAQVDLDTVRTKAQPYLVPAVTENTGKINRLAIETITK